MGKLIYSAIVSLDGYVSDAAGNFDWSAPDAEVHAFINDLERSVGTYLYGRRMYEVMLAWETMDLADEPAVMLDYAEIWRAADKVVFSTTVTDAASSRTRVERTFDPGAVRRLVTSADRDVSIGGTDLAADAIRAGIVEEYQLFISPVVVGGGTPFLPGGVPLSLELLEERRFGNGVVYLRYRAAS